MNALTMRYFLSVVLLSTVMSLSVSADVLAQDREIREVDPFTQIGFAISGTLYISEGQDHSVEVVGTAEELEHVETVVENGRLRIRGSQDSGWLSWFWSSSRRSVSADVYVSLPSLEGVSIAGSGDVIGETPFSADAFSVEIAGSGNTQLELDANSVTVRIAGSGTASLSGSSETLKADIAGSGNVRASGMNVATAEVNIAGSGDCYVYARELVKANIMGSGDVIYRGDPQVDSTVMGSGRVRAADS